MHYFLTLLSLGFFCSLIPEVRIGGGLLELNKITAKTFLVSGGSPYPRMDGRKIASLLQGGYRMPKPQHVDDEL